MAEKYEQILPSDYTIFPRSELESSILRRFQNIARENENAVAIKDINMELTYGDLDRESNRIAHSILRCTGPKPEPIAMLYEHGVDFHKAQLGVLKSGNFYAGIEPELSFEKQLSLLENLEPRLLICADELEPLATRLAERLSGAIVLNTQSGELAQDITEPDTNTDADSIAYIIYTSGSTGAPNGVVVSHRNVLHFTMNHTNCMHLRKVDRALQICPLSSAACAGETFPVLLTGGTLLPFSVKRQGVSKLIQWLIDERCTICTFVPALFRLLFSRLPSGMKFPDMRLIRLSGDRILKTDCEVFRDVFSDHCLLRASLGASEVLLFTQFYVSRAGIPDREIVPAGYPLEDMEVFIVDEELKRLSQGETGEIAVKSRYLSVGYWHNDELTSARFVDSGDDDGSRIYLTRDVGYLEEDGCLVHLGRNDSRVKIHGKMVTITDVETALLTLPEIKEAAVVAVAHAGETFLDAYIVVACDKSLPNNVLRKRLLERLPAEIVPKRFIELSELPLTPRNKIDRRKLAEISQERLG